MEPNPDKSSSFNEANANQESDLPDYFPVREVETTSETVDLNVRDSISDVNLSSDSPEQYAAVAEEQGNDSEIPAESDESLDSESVRQQIDYVNENIRKMMILLNFLGLEEDDDSDTGIDSGDESSDDED